MIIIIPLFTLLADAQKNVTISPNCGSEEGFEVTLETDGFGPNSNVHWDLVNEKITQLHSRVILQQIVVVVLKNVHLLMILTVEITK